MAGWRAKTVGQSVVARWRLPSGYIVIVLNLVTHIYAVFDNSFTTILMYTGMFRLTDVRHSINTVASTEFKSLADNTYITYDLTIMCFTNAMPLTYVITNT